MAPSAKSREIAASSTWSPISRRLRRPRSSPTRRPGCHPAPRGRTECVDLGRRGARPPQPGRAGRRTATGQRSPAGEQRPDAPARRPARLAPPRIGQGAGASAAPGPGEPSSVPSSRGARVSRPRRRPRHRRHHRRAHPGRHRRRRPRGRAPHRPRRRRHHRRARPERHGAAVRGAVRPTVRAAVGTTVMLARIAAAPPSAGPCSCSDTSSPSVRTGMRMCPRGARS